MYFAFGPLSVLLLFFVVQGLLFSALLLAKRLRNEDPASGWLSLFLLLGSAYLAPWMFGYANWYARDGYREVLFFVPFQQLFLIGPVVYFYTRSLLDSQYKVKQTEWWHLLLPALYLLYSLIVFAVDELLLDTYYFYADGRDQDFDPWYQISGHFSIFSYTLLSLGYYRGYRRRIVEQLSFADTVQYRWVFRFLIVLLLIVSLWLLLFLFYPRWGAFGAKWWYYAAFGALSYYIGLGGYANRVESSLAVHLQPTVPSSMGSPSQKTEDPPQHLEPLKERLLEIMEKEALYRNSTLTLSDLATELQVTSKQVSIVVNRRMGVNFNDFVNRYRVEAVKQAFARGDQHERTLLGIALDCGFNSKTTFNRVFKRMTGKTPLQYQKDQEN